MSHCPKCDAELPEDARFCNHCGFNQTNARIMAIAEQLKPSSSASGSQGRSPFATPSSTPHAEETPRAIQPDAKHGPGRDLLESGSTNDATITPPPPTPIPYPPTPALVQQPEPEEVQQPEESRASSEREDINLPSKVQDGPTQEGLPESIQPVRTNTPRQSSVSQASGKTRRMSRTGKTRITRVEKTEYEAPAHPLPPVQESTGEPISTHPVPKDVQNTPAPTPPPSPEVPVQDHSSQQRSFSPLLRPNMADPSKRLSLKQRYMAEQQTRAYPSLSSGKPNSGELSHAGGEAPVSQAPSTTETPTWEEKTQLSPPPQSLSMYAPLPAQNRPTPPASSNPEEHVPDKDATSMPPQTPYISDDLTLRPDTEVPSAPTEQEQTVVASDQHAPSSSIVELPTMALPLDQIRPPAENQPQGQRENQPQPYQGQPPAPPQEREVSQQRPPVVQQPISQQEPQPMHHQPMQYQQPQETEAAAEQWRQNWKDRQLAEGAPAFNPSRGQAVVSQPLVNHGFAQVRAVVNVKKRRSRSFFLTPVGFILALILATCLIGGAVGSVLFLLVLRR